MGLIKVTKNGADAFNNLFVLFTDKLHNASSGERTCYLIFNLIFNNF
jgi:hypothetical protein